MTAAKTRMRSAFGQGGFLASVGALAALTASIVAFSGDVALAQNAECARLAASDRCAPRVERLAGRR